MAPISAIITAPTTMPRITAAGSLPRALFNSNAITPVKVASTTPSSTLAAMN